ncbi:hypothetical protein IPJ72_05600 [Candidatus Peregrinibacteria bacterium]|nr:MAG: hypothetical protein IPJ72_05600 [Candidatus Peregrinibacteria bacterium]
MKKRLLSFVKKHTTRLVDDNEKKFALYPRWLIWLILFLSYNVLIQGIMDVVLKVAGHTPWLQTLPVRIDFLFLTVVSILMGYQALVGMRRREMDVTKNSIALGIIVEIGLVVSDIIHVVQYGESYNYLLLIRAPFIVLTTINFFILIVVSYYLKLFVDKKGHFHLA